MADARDVLIAADKALEPFAAMHSIFKAVDAKLSPAEAAFDGDSVHLNMSRAVFAAASSALALIRASLTAPSASVGEWQTVPVEPTPEMRSAFHSVANYALDANGNAQPIWSKQYAAMLAAAPASPSPGKATAEMADAAQTAFDGYWEGVGKDKGTVLGRMEHAINAALSVRAADE
jgi:hypothetical protein